MLGDPSVTEVPRTTSIPSSFRVSSEVSTFSSFAAGRNSAYPPMQENPLSPSQCDAPSNVVPLVSGLNSTTAPPVSPHDLSVFGCSSSTMPFGGAMGSWSMPKVPHKPPVKGQKVVTTKASRLKILPNVPFVPIDYVSFHYEDSVYRWKYVF